MDNSIFTSIENEIKRFQVITASPSMWFISLSLTEAKQAKLLDGAKWLYRCTNRSSVMNASLTPTESSNQVPKTWPKRYDAKFHLSCKFLMHGNIHGLMNIASNYWFTHQSSDFTINTTADCWMTLYRWLSLIIGITPSKFFSEKSSGIMDDWLAPDWVSTHPLTPSHLLPSSLFVGQGIAHPISRKLFELGSITVEETEETLLCVTLPETSVVGISLMALFSMYDADFGWALCSAMGWFHF